MKLEVGMYVRTKHNGIFNIQVLEAIRDINCDYIEINYIKFPRNEILKTSHNIIDLIEVGDYVNGYKISGVYDDDGVVNEYNLKHKKCLGKNIYDEDYQEYLIYEEEIETVVTKEQFAAMQYEVK